VPSVDIRDVSLGFGSGPARARALNCINLSLQSGIFTVVSGPSGSGKTSLLSVLGAMLSPDRGSVNVDGTDIAAFGSVDRSTFRREKIGYVFQLFRLMPALNAEENIMLSLELRRQDGDRRRALESLDLVGLADKAHLRPRQMSGGEQQRVAIARAIAHRPVILLADEPTASLDSANGLKVTKLLAKLAEDTTRIVVVVTHDPRVLPFAHRIVSLEDGRIAADELCIAPSGS
jgi:putative ABC transport system ATP-binding protein